MAFSDYLQLADFYRSLGVKRAIFKPLSENDNTKQQIYLGGSFEALNQLPFGNISIGNESGRPNYKAPVELWWIDNNGNTEPAVYAQLILYPKYPEVRLSGFLRGCSIAPSEYLKPVPRDMRSGVDGRFLIFGITDSGRIYAYLAPSGSPVAESIKSAALDTGNPLGVFIGFPLGVQLDSKAFLLSALSRIHKVGWHESCRLDRNGNVIPYRASNGGGYTLEALMGIIPNGRSEPDFMGWELKAFSGNRITLMTPEPDSGYYGEQGAEAFVRQFGHDAGNDVLYFTGTHKVDAICNSSEMIMRLEGFNPVSSHITDPSGGILLLSDSGFLAAKWSFSRLLEHWGRKHAQAAYIRYDKQKNHDLISYHYKSPSWLGEGTDFTMFLKAINSGLVVYDPATKVTDASSVKSKVKARSQFRIGFNNINSLYNIFNEYAL